MDTVKRVLKETDLPPSDLELEITESVFLGDIEEAVRTLSELKSMGIAINSDPHLHHSLIGRGAPIVLIKSGVDRRVAA